MAVNEGSSYLPTSLLTHGSTHKLYFRSFHSFLKREPQICCSTRGHLLHSSKHTQLPQTDSPAQDAQHGEDQHYQVLLFLYCNFLNNCAIYVYHLFLALISPNNVAYYAGGTKSKKCIPLPEVGVVFEHGAGFVWIY